MCDKVILKKLKEGNREALGMLWKSQGANVLNLAFRMLGDRDDAEDILMDIFVQVPSSIQKFRGESSLGTWLYRLTVNACLMKLRRNKRHSVLEEENQDRIMDESIGHGLSEELPRDYDPELLEMSLAKLNAETRSLLWLKDAEGLDIKDLSDIFNMAEGTVKARLSRARLFIRNFLTEKRNHA